jgi:hypothetical protein
MASRLTPDPEFGRSSLRETIGINLTDKLFNEWLTVPAYRNPMGLASEGTGRVN